MKKHIGNPFNEAHDKPMQIYEWIAPVGTDPFSLPTKLEAVLPGLCLQAKGGKQHGYINTSRRPDGSLYIAVALHLSSCTDPNCKAGEQDHNIKIEKAPQITKVNENAWQAAVGELQVSEFV